MALEAAWQRYPVYMGGFCDSVLSLGALGVSVCDRIAPNWNICGRHETNLTLKLEVDKGFKVLCDLTGCVLNQKRNAMRQAHMALVLRTND